MAGRKAWSDRTKWTMGIASALIVAAVIAFVGWLFQDAPGVPAQAVPFVATASHDFAIQSEIRGTARARGNELSVEVDRVSISYRPRGHGYEGPRTIVDLRASLVESHEGSWRAVRQSSPHRIGREIQPDGEIDLGPLSFTISLRGIESISRTWLVFDINEALPGQAPRGSSHAHTQAGLFSD